MDAPPAPAAPLEGSFHQVKPEPAATNPPGDEVKTTGSNKPNAPLRDSGSKKKLKDPAESGRCSIGRFAYGILAVAGVVFFLFGVSADPIDAWEMCNAAFLFLQSMYTIIFLGGDPCLIKAFQESVQNFHAENKCLETSNDTLEMKLGELGKVADGLEDISKQMGRDIDAATDLLIDMERFSNLQTASAVVHQFFAADFDGSGHISGAEAEYFVPQFVTLWEMLPNFDQQRLVDHVRAKGLTLQQLSILLDALTSDDPVAVQRELEAMLEGHVAAASGSVQPQVLGNPTGSDVGLPPRPVACEMVHTAAPPSEADIEAMGAVVQVEPKVLDTLGFEGKIGKAKSKLKAEAKSKGKAKAKSKAPLGKKACVVREARHQMMPDVNFGKPPEEGGQGGPAQTPPPASMPEAPREPADPELGQQIQEVVGAGETAKKSEDQKATKSEGEDPKAKGGGRDRMGELQSRCSCFKKDSDDPMAPCLDMGCFLIWGWTHFIMIICALGSLIFVGSSFVIMELTNTVCSLIAASLAIGLMASSRLLKVLSALKKEVKFLSHENDRLEGLNQQLAERVAQLVRLQRGFEILQTKCHGNVLEAQKLIKKSNLAIKSSAMGVVTRLFIKGADLNRNHVLDESEVDNFIQNLDLVFHSVPNFDSGVIRESILSNGLNARQLKDIVDTITAASAE